MLRIMINTSVNAPGCPCEIIAVHRNGKPVKDIAGILVQTDWDYPGFAGTFGWSLAEVQRCSCGNVCGIKYDKKMKRFPAQYACPECGIIGTTCLHDMTDGTVKCECNTQPGDFMAAAYDYLRDNDGKIVDDPGYFEG